MLYLKLIFTFFLSITLYFISPFKYFWEEAPRIQSLWGFNFTSEKNSPNETQYVSMLKIEKDGNTSILFPEENRKIEIRLNERVSVPYLGDGFFGYEKSSQEIVHYDKYYTELWRKNFPSYPFSNPFGNLILLINGDSTQVEVIDYNGIEVGVKKITGSFLTSFHFATETPHTLLCFASGEIYILNEIGELLIQDSLEGKWDRQNQEARENFFTKSCAISADGKSIAIHVLEGREDKVYIYNTIQSKEKKLKRLRKIILPKIYPHLVHMAINSMGLVVATPDKNYFWGIEKSWWGKITNASKDWQEENQCDNECGVYRPVFASQDYFFYGNDNTWTVLDKRGVKLFTTEHHFQSNKNNFWRFIASFPESQKRKNKVGMQFQDTVLYFSIHNF